MAKKSITVKVHLKKDSAGNITSVVVEVNTAGSVEKRYFASKKAAYQYIETLKKNR